jgi:hypothetical protein
MTNDEKEFFLLGYDAVYSVENQPNSGRTCHLQFQASYLLRAGFLIEPFLHPENGGDMFLRNVG